jgi:hypothetical protein
MKGKVLVVLSVLFMATPTFASMLSIANAGFETDAAPVVGATGWTITSGGTDWFTTTAGAADSINDPLAAAEGVNWLSGNRLATGAGSSSNPQTIVQLVDISGDAALIDAGNALVTLDFMFSDSDQNDDGTINITFFSDVAGTTAIGTALTTGIITPTAPDGSERAPWAARNLSGAVPALARSLEIEIYNIRAAGSAGNVHFDDLQGAIVPEPATMALLGLGAVLLRRRK